FATTPAPPTSPRLCSMPKVDSRCEHSQEPSFPSTLLTPHFACWGGAAGSTPSLARKSITIDLATGPSSPTSSIPIGGLHWPPSTRGAEISPASKGFWMVCPPPSLAGSRSTWRTEAAGRNHLHRSLGAAIVELAIVLPLFVVLLLYALYFLE